MSREEKWYKFYLGMAEYISTASKDPSTKAGCVITTKDHRIISLGYNGFPQGIEDKPEELENRNIKLQLTLHAEENAIAFATRSLKGAIVYTVPFSPCGHCAAWLIQKKIGKVVFRKNSWERWEDSCKLALEKFKEKGIETICYTG